MRPLVVLRRALAALVEDGFNERNEIAGDEDQAVAEDANQIEQRVVAGNDTAGLDTGDVGLGQADELA